MKDGAPKRIKNLGLAAIAGQAGCATLIIVFAALFIGLWFDSQFGLRGPCTFGMLIFSIPFSLFVMLKIAISAIERIQPQPVRTRPESLFEEE
ncbi:MAG: hypothetical protein MUF87_14475 [Anaerolineae bacterium]|jgi:hypothetical protein|nr:hypothetical protein [Anaerolineae bacterium]